MQLDKGKDFQPCAERDARPDDDPNYDDDYIDEGHVVDKSKFIEASQCLKRYNIPSAFLTCALEINPYYQFEPYSNNSTVKYIQKDNKHIKDAECSGAYFDFMQSKKYSSSNKTWESVQKTKYPDCVDVEIEFAPKMIKCLEKTDLKTKLYSELKPKEQLTNLTDQLHKECDVNFNANYNPHIQIDEVPYTNGNYQTCNYVTGNSRYIGPDECINSLAANRTYFDFPYLNKFLCLTQRFGYSVGI